MTVVRYPPQAQFQAPAVHAGGLRMNPSELTRVASAMVAKGKGILAADESGGTIKKRFDGIKLESTEEHRRSYREMLFTAPGAAASVSGVILYDETIRQKTKDGTPFPHYLTKQGIIPGIKVDLGAKPLAGFPGETITEGLDGLRERLSEYRGLGARFAKWRAVIDIADNIPTRFAIAANAHALARYAALCQENDIVPIVEPEVLMDGGHSIERCEQVSDDVLERVFHELFEHRVLLECMVLKPNMVISGKKAANRAPPQAVAEATVRMLKRRVPPALPGIAFLSGGQSPTEATLHLSLMNRLGPLPWSLTFSYGRALQDTALKAWGGVAANFAAGQKEYAKRAKLNGLATTGRYASEMESQAA
jgi:fructose-bisphosphate aldolase class I